MRAPPLSSRRAQTAAARGLRVGRKDTQPKRLCEQDGGERRHRRPRPRGDAAAGRGGRSGSDGSSGQLLAYPFLSTPLILRVCLSKQHGRGGAFISQLWARRGKGVRGDRWRGAYRPLRAEATAGCPAAASAAAAPPSMRPRAGERRSRLAENRRQLGWPPHQCQRISQAGEGGRS